MNNKYQSPFSTRYASDEMQYIFSQEFKIKTWRRLWIALAKAEKKLGLEISEDQIKELEKYKDNINFDVAKEREKECRHDVMAHIYAYGKQCPNAKKILHLGATSCYVGDNSDIIAIKEAMEILKRKIVNIISILSDFAFKYKDLPTLAYTHLQPAQLTTVGKRACLWINELYIDLQEIDFRLENLKLLGSKGTTGTQASFLELFEGDESKIDELENLIASEMGFKKCVEVSGQTYSRKIDSQVLSTLSGIAQSASKFSNDIRILQSFKEIEEPFEKHQIGSSAMPYKRNPIRSERITSLSRYVIVNSLNPGFTASTQWFERTLDDSANKRISISEGFLAVDSILNIFLNIVDGLVVYKKVIERRVKNELAFMATENIMMAAVKKGGDRQVIHERLRELSMEAGREVKENGGENDLIDRIAKDKYFNLTKQELEQQLDPKKFIGRSSHQVEIFLANEIRPLLEKNKDILGEKYLLTV
ncbi:MAG: adenylosuccinate lyase [Oscillospiraceae bacterium]|nr:adenylosuccinate lyase [Oscillospiraceae bacterium]